MIGFVTGSPIIRGQARLLSLPAAESSMTIGSRQVSADACTVNLTATKTGAKAIRSCSVSIVYFPRAGIHGFASRLSPLTTGQSHQGNLAISNQVPLSTDTTLIMAVKSLPFSGRKRCWRARHDNEAGASQVKLQVSACPRDT